MKLTQEGYKNDIPQDVVSGDKDTPLMKRVLRLINEGDEKFSQRKGEIIDIVSAIEAPNMIKEFNDDGLAFCYGRLLSDAVENHLSKDDFLSWDLKTVENINVSQTDNGMAQIAKAVGRSFLQEMLEEADFNRVMGKDKFGVQRERAIKGNAFVLISGEEDKKKPVKLKSILLQNVKLPRAAKCWDDVLNKNKEITLVFDVSDYDEFIAEFGANTKAKKLSWGDLPSSFSDNIYQEDNLSDNRRRGQWGLYCNWADKTAIWFAGPDMTIFKEMSGDEYPFRDIDKEPTCPVFMYRFADSVKDFWDNGIGDIFYQLNNLDEFNINNKIIANQMAAREYNMLTVPTDKKIDAEIGVLEMEEARQGGRVGWLINEINQGEESIVSYQRIGGASAALDESVSLDNLLAEKTTDAGIRLKEVDSQRGEPLGSFQIALENANAKARDVNRRNAPEFERMLEYFYQTCLTQVSPSDDTVIDIDEEEVEILGKKMNLKDALKIASAGGKAITNVTRGFAVKMLKEFKPFFKVEPLSGATPNAMIELAKQESLLGILAGTPADIKLRKKMAQELGFSFGEEELQQAIPQAPQTQQAPSQSLLNQNV